MKRSHFSPLTRKALADAFAFSADQRTTPEISFDVQSVNPAVVPALEAQPNVRAVQVSTRYGARWQIAATPGHANISIVAFPDLAHITLSGFQLTSGRLPGPGEIVME